MVDDAIVEGKDGRAGAENNSHVHEGVFDRGVVLQVDRVAEEHYSLLTQDRQDLLECLLNHVHFDWLGQGDAPHAGL